MATTAYRYITLGFGSELAKVSTYTDAGSVDGDYNSARLLPEMTHYGSAQLTNAKFYGSAGMASLRAMLEHANRYGLKYIFVHDPYYEPLLTFAGWRKIETFNNGDDHRLVEGRRSARSQNRVGRDAAAVARVCVGNLADRREFPGDFLRIPVARGPPSRNARRSRPSVQQHA